MFTLCYNDIASGKGMFGNGIIYNFVNFGFIKNMIFLMGVFLIGLNGDTGIVCELVEVYG